MHKIHAFLIVLTALLLMEALMLAQEAGEGDPRYEAAPAHARQNGAPSTPPAFEVASIRQNAEGGVPRMRVEGGRFLASNRSVTRASAILSLQSAVMCVAAVVVPAVTRGQIIDLVTDSPPVVREAVPAVLDLFEQYSIVALSEGPHNNQKGHEFRLALVRDPRFGRIVDDVVVEFGNSRYQGVMDRFTTGADVPYRELRQVWENTTIPGAVWDSPIYRELFAAIRDVNHATGSHIRVLLGDPPVDWASIRSAEQIDANYQQRDRYPATVVQQEVLKKNRRALIVYGEGHLLTSGRLGTDTLVDILQRESNVRIFTISNGYADLAAFQNKATWPMPALVMVKRSTVGGAPSAAGTPLALDFDAVLHLGGPSALSMTEVDKSVCQDPEYVKMRLERYALTATPANPDPAAELKTLCGLTGRPREN